MICEINSFSIVFRFGTRPDNPCDFCDIFSLENAFGLSLHEQFERDLGEDMRNCIINGQVEARKLETILKRVYVK